MKGNNNGTLLESNNNGIFGNHQNNNNNEDDSEAFSYYGLNVLFKNRGEGLWLQSDTILKEQFLAPTVRVSN
jgi:hypothetical protein